MYSSGAGTDVCNGCKGPKETTRRGSNKCRVCNNPSSKSGPVKTIRTVLPAEVWDALQAEADRKGTTIGALLRDLVVARHERLNK